MNKARVFRFARVVAFNLALMLVLAEIVALAAYWQRTGEVYYLSKPIGRSVPVDLTGGVEQFRLHPYLGFVNRPSGRLNNNHGFVSRHDYPYLPRQQGEYVVGIFGGSVAAELAVFEFEHRVLARRLEAELDLPPGRVTVLNFALGGFKQPQQWLTYGFFRALGQDIDLAINIDGFNEIALTGRNRDSGVALEMPSFDHLKALRDVTGQASSLGGVERMLRIRSEWKKFARTFNRAWAGQSWELVTASGFLADFLIYKFHLRRHRALLERHIEATGSGQDDSWLMLTSREPGTSAAAVVAAIELWTQSSVMMAEAQAAVGRQYFHFVQPNQYFATRRLFSEEERAIAFSEESVFAEYIREDYHRLVAEVSALQSQGVAVHSLVELFDDVNEPVYKDDCCHYNDLGQRLLAEAIFEAFSAAASLTAGAED